MYSETLPKPPKAERLKYIREEAEKIGFHNINRTELAKKFNCTPRTIYTDIKKLYDLGVAEDCVKKSMLDLHNLHKSLFKELQLEFNNSENKNKVSLAYALMQLQDKMIAYYESFGLKEKVADKIEGDFSFAEAVLHAHERIKQKTN
jgi:predicted transcriptional regulator